MEIRQATLADLEAIAELKLRSKASEREHSTSLRPIAECRERYLSYLRTDLTQEDRAVFVALEGGEPVGIITGRIYGTLLIRVHRKQGHISSLFVDPEHRKQGAAGRLVEALLDWFRERGVEVVRLAVHSGNEAARKLLGDLGFEEYAVEMTRSLPPTSDQSSGA